MDQLRIKCSFGELGKVEGFLSMMGTEVVSVKENRV